MQRDNRTRWLVGGPSTGQPGQQPGQIQLQVPLLIPVMPDGFYITPTFLQLIVGVEVTPITPREAVRSREEAGRSLDTGGTLKTGDVRLKVMLASGRDVELDPQQADAFLTMIGVRETLVQPASSIHQM